jgi:hypothetical protein
LDRINVPDVEAIDTFVDQLQNKLDHKLVDSDDNENPPDAPLLTDIFSS